MIFKATEIEKISLNCQQLLS